MGRMTFEKVLSRAAGWLKRWFWRPTGDRIGRYFPADFTANFHAQMGPFSLSGHPNPTSSLLFSPLKNRYTTRNNCNGMQWGAMNAMNFRITLHYPA